VQAARISRFYNQAFGSSREMARIKTVSIRCMQPVIQSIGNCHAASGGLPETIRSMKATE